MSKTKTPFFGLASQGSIGGSITTQKRGSATLVRSKPIPTDPRSLGQSYQRWLYEDYVYLWNQASKATRDTYRTSGTRYHLTAFQYWMRYHLRKLPDILAWWKLDDNLGARTIDSSRHENTGTIIGASPATGLINGCLSFDGINDLLNCGKAASLNTIPTFTFETFVYITSWDNSPRIWDKAIRTCYIWGAGRMANVILASITSADSTTTTTISKNQWHMIHYSYDDIGDRKIYLYLNNVEVAYSLQRAAVGVLTDGSANDLILGNRIAAANPLEGRLDNPIFYNRILDSTERQRHMERRYPLQ